MYIESDPVYVRRGCEDVERTVPFYDFKVYDYGETPVFHHPIMPKMPTVDRPFFWDVYTFGSNFWDMIKNQIHIFPTMYLDFGLVLSQREEDFYIWNSYTTKSAYIEEPVTLGDYGTTFVVDVAGNFTLEPGKGTAATLTVFTEGPVSSATNFQITVTVFEEEPLVYLIQTLANRVISFPFWPDWSKKVEFKLKFNTVISKSTQNYEQRRPLLTKPQRSFGFTHLDTTYGLVTNAMSFAQDKSIGIPVAHEMFNVVSIDADGMGITIRENTSDLWHLKRFCKYIYLLDRSRNVWVVKEIVSIETNRINVENPILESFGDPAAIAGFPMIIGVFGSAKPTVLNGNLISWDMSFSELIGMNQPDLVDVPAFPSSLPNKFDWTKKVDFEQNVYRDIGEFAGTAQLLYQKFPLNKNVPKTFTGTFILKSRAELCSFLDFICGSKGRTKKFEYLWPMNEFQLIGGEYEGVNQLRVRNTYFAEQFQKILNNKVVIRYRDNVMNTTIVAASSTSQFTKITLSNLTDFRIFDEDCETLRIEQYKTVRFDLDEFTIECLSGKVFSVNVRFAEVYQ